MKKIALWLVAALVILVAIGWVAWEAKANLAAQYLSRQLHVPVTVQSLEIAENGASLTQLWVGNPRRSHSRTAFAADTIAVFSTLKQIRSDPLVIDEIDISNIFVGIEFYQDRKTNWDHILDAGKTRKKAGRDYLIRKLVLTNLTIEVTQPNGQTKQYPTLARMEFHNISSETGFPIEEIEKAIFNQMMKELFQKLNLQDLLKQIPLPGGGNSPLQLLPGLLK